MRKIFFSKILVLSIGLGIGFFVGLLTEAHKQVSMNNMVLTKNEKSQEKNRGIKEVKEVVFQEKEIIPLFIQKDLEQAGFSIKGFSNKEWQEFLSFYKTQTLNTIELDTIISKKNTLLHILSQRQVIDIQLIKKLIEEGLDINKANSKGETPLMLAIKNATNINTIQHFVDLGADIHATAADGRNILNYALLHKDYAVKRFLIDKLTTEEGFSFDDTKQYLQDASEEGNKEFLLKLIPNIEKEEYEESLYTVLQEGAADDEIVTLFLKNIDPTQMQDLPALLLYNGQVTIETLKELQKNGVDINQQSSYDVSPLMGAVSTGDIQKVEFLLKNGARIDTGSRWGTAYDFLYDNDKYFPQQDKHKAIRKLLNTYAKKQQ